MGNISGCAGFCSRQIWHSAGSVARSALVVEVHAVKNESASPWPCTQPTGHSPRIRGQSRIRLFLLPNRLCDPVSRPSSALRRFPFGIAFQGYPTMQLYLFSCSILCGACITYRIISKPGPSLLSLSRLIIGHTPRGARLEAPGACLAADGWHYNWSRNHKHRDDFFL